MSTDTRPPIFRFASWLAHRRTLCVMCRREARVDIEGDTRYCSIGCMESDAENQAIA